MRTAITAMTALLGLAVMDGCGGGGGQASTPATPGQTAPPAPTSSVRLVAIPTNTFRFNTGHLSARPGTVEIKLINRDDVPHNVRIQPGTNCCFKPGSRDIGGTNTASPGESMTGTASVQRGVYTFYCAIAGHWQSGMRGRLVVR